MTYAHSYPSDDPLPQRGLQGFLVWLRLWLGWISGERSPDSRSNVPTYCEPRQRRRLCERFERCDLPPSRDTRPFRRLIGRCQTRGEYLERLCRLSVNGRIRIYRFIYFSHRQVREALMALGSLKDQSGGIWLWSAYLWPD